MRTDAERNRSRLLSTAQQMFAEHGAAIEMAQLAQRAGVGVGTLYRHFATKEALLLALVTSCIEAFLAEVRAAPDSDPGAAFFAFLDHLIEMYVGNKHLCDVGVLDGDLFCSVRTELEQVFSATLIRAQRAGAVRRDVTSSDVLAIVCGAFAMPVARDPATRQRIANVIADGLRAQPARKRGAKARTGSGT